jgi:hypothetical protein
MWIFMLKHAVYVNNSCLVRYEKVRVNDTLGKHRLASQNPGKVDRIIIGVPHSSEGSQSTNIATMFEVVESMSSRPALIGSRSLL